MFSCTRNSHLKAHVIRRLQSTSAKQIQYYLFPELPNLARFRETGIPGLLSQKALQTAYDDRVSLHLQKLNNALDGTSINTSADLDVLVDELSNAPKHIKVFNNASLINNICFSLSSIGQVRDSSNESTDKITKPGVSSLLQSPDVSNQISNVPTKLLSLIEREFGSLIEFKTLLLNSANAINGDGFTWIVARGKNQSGSSNAENLSFDRFFILNTYNAGSPKNFNRAGIFGETSSLQKTTILSVDDAKNVESYKPEIVYKPILAIDASPKVWLQDYGVFGKRLYLEQLWKSIDWEVVGNRVPSLNTNVLGSGRK